VLLAKAKTRTPVNLVRPIPIKTDETVFLRIFLSLSYLLKLLLSNMLIQTCALN